MQHDVLTLGELRIMLQKINTRLVAGILLTVAVLSQSPVVASEWMFRRSYHSHENGRVPPSGEVPWSRSAYREPFASGGAAGCRPFGVANQQLPVAKWQRV